jgi:hypothetical protein
MDSVLRGSVVQQICNKLAAPDVTYTIVTDFKGYKNIDEFYVFIHIFKFMHSFYMSQRVYVVVIESCPHVALLQSHTYGLIDFQAALLCFSRTENTKSISSLICLVSDVKPGIVSGNSMDYFQIVI